MLGFDLSSFNGQPERDAAHLQLFVEEYCASMREEIVLPYVDGTTLVHMACTLRGRTQAS